MARLRGPECTYHIMVRSISEVYLFEDDADKDRYLRTVKRYQDLFLFKIYAYCIMASHAHFVIYSDRLGFDEIALSSKPFRRVTAARSLYAALLRCFCDCKCYDLCEVMRNITQGGVSKLCAIGIKLIQEDEKYRNIAHDFILNHKDA